MISPQKLQANRANAMRSKGPRSPGGKCRSRLNAVTHGLTAQTLILPGEDEHAYQRRLAAWTHDLAPCNPYEEDLVAQAVSHSWRLDRADRVQAALLAERLAAGPGDDERRRREEVEDLGRRLWPDSGQPLPGDPPGNRPAISVSPEDPDDPARLVNRLEMIAEGCRWLLDRWAGLRAAADDGRAWSLEEMVGAIRLLGKQPLDAADDRQVLAIVRACSAMAPDGPDPFDRLLDSLTAREAEFYRRRLRGRGVGAARPGGDGEAREILLGVIDEAVEWLEIAEARCREREAALAATRAGRLLFDDSAEAEWLRFQQGKSTRAILRIVGRLREARRRGVELTPKPPAPPSPGGGPPAPRESFDGPRDGGGPRDGRAGPEPRAPEIRRSDLDDAADRATAADPAADRATVADAGPASAARRPSPSAAGSAPRRSSGRPPAVGRAAWRLIRLLGSLSLLLPFVRAVGPTEGSPPSDRPEVSARFIHAGDRHGSPDHRLPGLSGQESFRAPLQSGFEPQNRENEPKFAPLSRLFPVQPPQPGRSADRSRGPPSRCGDPS
jgi:hypothetical protein